MAGGKGKSSGGKSSGGKTSADGAKKQQSHSARAGLQVRCIGVRVQNLRIQAFRLRGTPCDEAYRLRRAATRRASMLGGVGARRRGLHIPTAWCRNVLSALGMRL
jgi:hypothetical protein